MKTLTLAFASICFFATASFAQVINTCAGDGPGTYGTDGVAATLTSLNTPSGVAVDAAGNIYIADYGNNRIRKVDLAGIITTIAGTGVGGFGGDNGPATAAQILGPRGIAVDAAGNVFFSDANNRIRQINSAGIVSTVAGSNAVGGYGGDGAPATLARLNLPWGIAVDAAGNIYIADQMNNRIRKVNTTGIISTITGTGIAFGGGDGGPATAAQVQFPLGVAVDAIGNVFIADNGNNRIRKINTSGVINTIAGSPTYGYSGDGGPASAAKLYYPKAVATDNVGNIYIADVNNNCIRKINTLGNIYTITGNGTAGFSGDGGPATGAKLDQATGIAVSSTGAIFIADNNNNRVRVITAPSHNPSFAGGHRQAINLCPIGITKSLDTVLAINDIDVGQTETLTLISGPLHGTAIVSYSGTSIGAVIIPTALTYTATAGYTGTDSIKVRVFDGTGADTTTIIIKMGCITGVRPTGKSTGDRLIIYPNPNTRLFSLTVPSVLEEQARVVITSAGGAKVKETTLTTNKPMDMNLEVPPGIYFISATSEHSSWADTFEVR